MTFRPHWQRHVPDGAGGRAVYSGGDHNDYGVHEWQAHVKPNGCIQLSHELAGVDDAGEIHICNVDDFIARMEELRDISPYHGKKETPVPTGKAEMLFEDYVAWHLNKMRETLLKKRADYGGENLAVDGERGIVTRTGDKIARIRNLHDTGKAPNFEGMEDSWLDVACYAVLALIMREVGVEAFRTLKLAPEVAEDDLPF